jgi:hypothetical protein
MTAKPSAEKLSEHKEQLVKLLPDPPRDLCDPTSLWLLTNILQAERNAAMQVKAQVPELFVINADGDGKEIEDVKAKLAELVDKTRSERGGNLRSAKKKREEISAGELARQKNEGPTLLKKYPSLGWGPPPDLQIRILDADVYKQLRSNAMSLAGEHGVRVVDQMTGNSDLTWPHQPLAYGQLEDLMMRVLRDDAKPDRELRDVTAFFVRKNLKRIGLVMYDRTAMPLLDALKELKKPDKNGAPLNGDQVAIITRETLRSMLDFEKNAYSIKELPSRFVIALVNDLAQYKDMESAPLIKQLLKSPDRSVRIAAAQALSSLSTMPSEEWAFGVHVPDPRLTPETRAERVRKALAGGDKDADKCVVDWGLGEPVVEAIASAYKAPAGTTFITDANDPGLKYLDKALDSEHLAVRFITAQVLAESDLDVDNPVRKKAIVTLADSLLSGGLGAKATKDAVAILDGSLPPGRSVRSEKYAIAKVKDFLPGLKLEIPNIHDCLLVQDDGYFYSWLDDGSKTYVTPREVSFSVGDGTATLKRGIFDVSAKYAGGGKVEWRSAELDGDAVIKMSWQAKGATGPYVAVRVKENGKYIDAYDLTIPGTDKNRLTHTVRIKGKFEMSRETGYFRYVGQDFTDVDESRHLLHPERTIVQSQGIKDEGLKQYSNRP